MPLPPTDRPDDGRAGRNPARVLLDSPLAAATRARVYHRTRQRPRERGLRLLAGFGAFVLHLVFLIIFVFGPAYELQPPDESKPDFVQVHLIETPEPPPPPPVRGAPPKVLGPRHQGHAARVVATAERSANVEAPEAAQPPSVPPTPLVAQASKPVAPARKRVAAPKPPVSLPHPAPTPQLQPIPLAGEPPMVTLPTPTVQNPVPPKFQPESVRPPQLEGNQPMPPPASLAMPELPAQSPPPIATPSIALSTDVPKANAPASIALARPQAPAVPPVPDLQAVPLPAQASPTVNLQAPLNPPTPSVPREMPQVQAPAVEVAEAQLEAVPLAPDTKPQVETHAPAVKIDIADKSPTLAIQPSIARPQLAPATAATSAPPSTAATKAADSTASAKSATSKPASTDTANTSDKSDASHDVSSSPDAIPFGSDTAMPGELNGVADAKETEGKHANGPPSNPGQGITKGEGDKGKGIGQTGGNQPGAEQGEKQGELGSYVQLKPTGDTDIMAHGKPSIDYKATRFDQDWTPEGESSVDTALRHAVEKTTVKHTIHLPRGLRVECAVTPLMPMALFGCHGADPPPVPVAAKVYERMRLAPAKPLVPPAPAASTAQPAAQMVKVDNGPECAAARITGGPLPPGCEGNLVPVVTRALAPAPAASSWVPASDQFH
ncbi:MAG TPA: hypothetical protein VGC19_01890 [Rhodanobacter sp.]